MSLRVSNSQTHRHYLPDDAISVRADTLDRQACAFLPFNPAQAFPETPRGSHIERIQNRAQRPGGYLGVIEELAGREQPVANCLTNCREQIGGSHVITTEITDMLLPRKVSAKAAYLGEKLLQNDCYRLGFGSVVFVSRDAQDTQTGPAPLSLCIGSAYSIGAARRAHGRLRCLSQY